MAEIRIACKLPALRRKDAAVYRLKPPAVSERALRDAVRGFGIDAAAREVRISSDRDKLVLVAGAHAVAMYRASGGIRFRDRSRWQVDDGKTNLEISDGDAFRRAQGVAEQFGFAGGDSRPLRAARLRVGEANAEAREAYERTIDVAVALQRMVDDTPVDGPGGQTVVYLGADGHPSGCERIWRAIDQVVDKAAPLVGPEAAIEEMAAQYRAKRGTIVVEEVRFGYFEAGWRMRQLYLQPAYVILGRATASERVGRKIAYVAAGLGKPLARLTPRLGRKAPQPARRAR